MGLQRPFQVFSEIFGPFLRVYGILPTSPLCFRKRFSVFGAVQRQFKRFRVVSGKFHGAQGFQWMFKRCFWNVSWSI